MPQASKAFALLAAYATDVVDPAVPSSALKRHAKATVRTTGEAAWALEAYRLHGALSAADLSRMAQSLSGDTSGTTPDTAARLAGILKRMGMEKRR